MATLTEKAWVFLTRWSGSNYIVPVTRRGQSIFVPHPQDKGRTWRIQAATFDAGQYHSRNDWSIKKYDDATAASLKERGIPIAEHIR